MAFNCCLLLSSRLVIGLCLVRLKQMTHGTPEDIAEMLLHQREDFVDVASSPSHNDSLANIGDSNSESWSGGSDDIVYESDSSKRVKVTIATSCCYCRDSFPL
jgi:hypothetical protein